MVTTGYGPSFSWSCMSTKWKQSRIHCRSCTAHRRGHACDGHAHAHASTRKYAYNTQVQTSPCSARVVTRQHVQHQDWCGQTHAVPGHDTWHVTLMMAWRKWSLCALWRHGNRGMPPRRRARAVSKNAVCRARRACGPHCNTHACYVACGVWHVAHEALPIVPTWQLVQHSFIRLRRPFYTHATQRVYYLKDRDSRPKIWYRAAGSTALAFPHVLLTLADNDHELARN